MVYKFDSRNHQSFFEDLKEDGYHVYARKNAIDPDFYPSKIPSHPEVSLSDIVEGSRIVVRVFFATGDPDLPTVDSGELDLVVELVEKETDVIWGDIATELPKEFALGRGTTIELVADEVLNVREAG